MSSRVWPGVIGPLPGGWARTWFRKLPFTADAVWLRCLLLMVAALCALQALLALASLPGMQWPAATAVPSDPSSSNPAHFQAQAQTQAPVSDTALEALLRMPLFGDLYREAQPVAPEANIAETRLALRLQGVVRGVEVEQSRALISANGVARLYRVGEALDGPPGVVLSLIERDHVVLEQDARRERLRLFDATGVAGGGATAGAEATVASARASGSAGAEAPGDDAIDVVAAGYESGAGLHLPAGEHSAGLLRHGIYPGDVITRVDDRVIEDPDTAVLAWRHLRSGRAAEVTVLRQGDEVRIRLDSTANAVGAGEA